MERTRNTERTPVTISQEDDEEEYLKSTQNPLDESNLAILVSSITGEMDNDIWINAKMSVLYTPPPTPADSSICHKSNKFVT